MTSTSTEARRRAQRSSPRRGLVSQTLLLAFSTGVGQLIVAGLYIWTARLVGPDDFGPAVAAIGIGSTIAGFLDFGSNNLWVREMAASRLELDAVGRRLCSKLFFSALAISLWCLVFLLISPSSLLWIAAPIAISLVLSQSFAVPLRAAGRSDLVAVSMLTDRLVAGSAFAVMNLAHVPATVALWLAMSLGPIVATVVSRKILRRSERPRLSFDLRTNPWRGSGFYGLSSAAASAQSLDLTIMNMVGGPSVAGLYGAVNRWTQPMSLLAGAFTISAAPLVARAASWAAVWPQIKRSVWLLAGSVLMCLFVAVMAEPVVAILVGNEFADSAMVLRVLALGTIGTVLNQPLAAFLQALGKDRIVSLIVTSGVVVQLLLVGVLTVATGATGAALSYCVLQTLIFVLLVVTVLTSRKRRPAGFVGRHCA
ncbi:lipopolysaccharide biosynthesis protein [Arthrobacter sp. Leaf145]|uniref:lipopolysaccharide biosynthesis protein n=1 Tax=Paenarthrobacter nicotinovorans TaxID=29320 RepID=UPI0009EC77A1